MKYLLLFLLASNTILGQVLIDTQSPNTPSEISANTLLEIRGNGKQAIRLPHIADDSSLTGNNAAQGMLAYREDQKCLTFYDGTDWSSCLEDIKTERLVKATFNSPSSNLNNSTTYQSFSVLTGSKTFEVDVVEAIVVFKVRSSHQIINNNGPGDYQCGSQELTLFVDNVLSESIQHTSQVDSSGRIFPVELYFIKKLSQGTHTFDLRYRNPNPSCSTNYANQYLSPTITITIREI